MAIKIKPFQKNAGGTLDEYKFASTGSIVDLAGYTPYSDAELDDIPAITAADDVNTAVKKLDGVTRVLDTNKAAADHTHDYAGASTPGGAATSAVKLNTTRAIDGVNFDGTAAIVHYGSCPTVAATAEKVVDCIGFTLVTGSRIAVKFSVSNTADNPTLNVNGSGAKSIFYRGAAIDKAILAANHVYEFVYDGTQYQLIGDLNTDTDTTYTASDGVTLSGTNFTNSGVRSVSTGATNGTISVNTNGTAAEVAVYGLASGAFAAAYEHPTTAGNKHIPSGGSSGKILKWSADGTATWEDETNTTYTGSDGITLTGTNFTNSGVRSVSTGATNGTISVNTGGSSSEVSVYGLGSAAYTSATDYASSGHGHTGADIPLTGYEKASSASAVAATDTTNEAIGKLEKALDGKQASGDYLTSSSDLNAAKLTGTVPAECYTDTTYTGSDGVTLTGTNFTNSGVRSVATGATNGTISVNTNGTAAEVSVYGLGSAAYTASTAYAASNHTHTASDIGAAEASHDHTVSDITDFPTIPTITDTYSGSSSDGMSGIAVKSAIDAALTSAYKPSGSVAFASLPTLSASVMGNVYNVSDSFTIDNRFIEYDSSKTKTFPAGTEVAVINTGSASSPTYKFSVMAGFIDLSDYQLAATAVTHTSGTAAGTATQPVYINTSGVAVACTYELNKTVPADAEFTDTTYSDFVGSGSSAAAGLVPKPSTTAGTTKYLREDGNWEVPPDTNTTYSDFVGSGASAAAGLVPAPGSTAGTSKFLCEDGSWAVPPDTTYSNFVGSGSSAAAGLVPAPGSTAGTTKYLREDGSWEVPPDTTYSAFVGSGSSAAAGLVPAPSTTAGTTKYLREDGNWEVPPDTVYEHPTTSGNKHIPSGGSSGKILKWSADGTATWADETDTTYTGSDGITLTGTNFTNSGVRSVSTGATNGTISVNTNGTAAEVAVYGLASGAFAAAYEHPTTSGNKHIPSGGSAGKILKWSADGTATWEDETDTTYSNFVGSGASAAAGLVPSPGTTAGTAKFLCEDGSWAVPPDTNTTYSNFVGSGSGAAAGLVPAPSTTAGTTKYLREDGSWAVPPDNNTTYTGSDGVTLTGTNFTNSGVRSISTGATNGTISVNTNGTANEVAVYGLGDAAYKAATYFATAGHTHNYAGSSSAGGAASTAVKLDTAVYVDGVSFDGSADIAHFGTCSTAAATAAKTVSCTGFALKTGSVINVYFSNAITVASATLNVNSTGAKNIYYRGAALAADIIASGVTAKFVYDGTQYNLVGNWDVWVTDT